MASWVKDQFNAYTQIAQLQRVYVAFQDLGDGAQWYIFGSLGTSQIPLKPPFASQAAAQTALDNAITNLGGSI